MAHKNPQAFVAQRAHLQFNGRATKIACSSYLSGPKYLSGKKLKKQQINSSQSDPIPKLVKCPHCSYCLNTDPEYTRRKPKHLWGFCCNACFGSKGGNHGEMCQRKPFRKKTGRQTAKLSTDELNLLSPSPVPKLASVSAELNSAGEYQTQVKPANTPSPPAPVNEHASIEHAQFELSPSSVALFPVEPKSPKSARREKERLAPPALCKQCQIEKPISGFSRRQRSGLGKGWCIVCVERDSKQIKSKSKDRQKSGKPARKHGNKENVGVRPVYGKQVQREDLPLTRSNQTWGAALRD
jgi:hypothetical protein